MTSKTTSLPRVLISILHWNDNEATRACLESVLADDYPNKTIVVTDNASATPIPDDIKQRFTSVIFLRNQQNLGFTGGHNTVLRNPEHAEVDYFWILNNDAQVVPGCLQTLIDTALKYPSAGLLSPQIGYLDNPQKTEFLAGLIDRERFTFPRLVDPVAVDQATRTSPDKIWLTGTALLINRRLADHNMLWLDDRLFAYYDDNDLSMRSTKAGFLNIAVPSSSILHRAPEDVISRAAHYHYLMTRNNWLFWKIHFPTGLLSRYLIEFIARTLMNAGGLLPDYPDKSRTVLLAAWHALTGRTGPPHMQKLPPMWLTRIILLAPYKTAAILRFFSPLIVYEKTHQKS